MLTKTLILLGLFCAATHVSCLIKVPCLITDVACTTESAKHLSKFIELGNPTYNIESSDPMYRDVINAFLPNVNYTLRNVTMRGLKECQVILLRLNLDESFYYYIMCPQLIVEGDYELNGDFASEHVEGKGKCKIVQDDYHIGIAGQYATVEGADGNPHIHVVQYDMDLLDVRGNIVYEFKNLFYGDEEKSKKIHKYLNENWKRVSAITQYPAMYSFMGKMLDNIDKYLATISKFDIFYKYV